MGLGHLAELRSLRRLSLKATRVSNAGLVAYLPEMPQLNGLTLAYVDMTDDGLAALDSLQWLDHVNITHTAVSNEAISNLVSQHAHTLRSLNLSNTVVSDAELANFPEQMQMHDLSLIDTGITDVGCEYIARCESLAELRLDLTDISDDGARQLANCRQLESLQLFGTQVTDTSLVWLSDSKVEHLGLGRTGITDAGIPALTDFPALESLDLQATAITDKGLRFVSDAVSLKRLSLDYNEITNAGLEFLLALPLETLSLNLQLDDSGLRTLAQHKNLLHLAMWNTRVRSWQPLTELDNLRILMIDDSIVDLSPLHELQQLEYLLLSGKLFSPTEVARLRLALPKCRIATISQHVLARDEFGKLVSNC